MRHTLYFERSICSKGLGYGEVKNFMPPCRKYSFGNKHIAFLCSMSVKLEAERVPNHVNVNLGMFKLCTIFKEQLTLKKPFYKTLDDFNVKRR